MIVRRLDANHDMTFGFGLANYARDTESVAQRVKTRLLTFQEEWFLDTSAGVPWFQRVFVKPANLPLVEALIKRTILETDDVADMLNFGNSWDRRSRDLAVSAELRTTFGETFNFEMIRP